VILVGLGVAAADLASKAVAVGMLGDRVVELAPLLRLFVARNAATVGWSGQAFQLAATGVLLLLIFLVIRNLAERDPDAPLAMGLLAGAAVGNLASALGSSYGVVDFIAIGTEGGAIVANLADLTVLAGLALLIRTVYRLARLLGNPARSPSSQ